jgi:hypothetical protein
LIELAELLRRDDMEAAERFEALEACLGGAGVDTELGKLGEHIGQFDFSTALASLVDLASSLGIDTKDESNE